MTGLRRTAAAAALLLALPLSVTAAAPASAAALATAAPASATAPAGLHVELPRPTGPFAVGREILELVDQGRTDPWVPSAGPRRLMVSVYYPARPGTGGPAPYMTPEAARLLLDGKLPGNTVPTEAVAGATTWSRGDARPRPGRYPLVVLSPGFTMPRTELTSLAEDLTSRGYVVALVDHTYENTGTTFPDGHTTTCPVCHTLTTPEQWKALDASRATDISFVVDRLTGHGPASWHYSRLIDRDRIGTGGHSAGGAAAVPALLADDRLRAGVDLDGSMDYGVPATGLGHKPFLMVGHPLGDGDEDPSWNGAWPRLDGWKRWLTVAGSNHGTFTDNPLFTEKFGVPNPPGTTVGAERGIQLTRQYVAAFFDLHLKGVPQPLLDGPTPDHPEVLFHP
ncbi:alpha/beta hydrolase family protein [Kitasatospora sp. NPDC088134]|uniref:alpha/beta hydrolase family protein n=1 Tax=Kitasatospora sp. NPDC088134 TaxID=3364071 RepID=UPI0038144E5F